jgi:hypothetical protein
MNDKLSIDRVREQEDANQPKKERAKQQVSQDQAAIEQRARAFDDDAETRTLRAGETPFADDAEAEAEAEES